jgi:hypothetical protein
MATAAEYAGSAPGMRKPAMDRERERRIHEHQHEQHAAHTEHRGELGHGQHVRLRISQASPVAVGREMREQRVDGHPDRGVREHVQPESNALITRRVEPTTNSHRSVINAVTMMTGTSGITLSSKARWRSCR